jgi:aminopeptidase YwaD
MSRAVKILFAAVALLVSALVLGACGSDVPPPPGGSVDGPVIQRAAAPTLQPALTPAAILAPAPAPPPSPTLGATPAPAATPNPPAATPRAPTAVLTPATPPSAADAATRSASEALATRLSGEAWDYLVTFIEEYSPRESGTDDEKAAADFLVEKFEALGYRAELQTFTIDVLSRVTPVLQLNTPEEREIDGFPLSLSGKGQAAGILVDVGIGHFEDFPQSTLEGKIALIQRGTLTFEVKVTRATNAGALAAVIYNNEPGGFGGLLARRAEIPAISISKESGEAIIELMAGGDVEATVSVIMETRQSRNVIAELPGSAETDKVVVLGGHFDTVPDTPGANDNGSGIATLLALAREASDRSYPFTLTFIAFGSEEMGLLGSRLYVGSLSEEERTAIVAMLNFDVTGSGNAVEVIGRFDLVSNVLELGKASGIEVNLGVPLEGASSDHASFLDVGIPAIFFLADDLSRLHTPEDRLEFIRPELMGAAAALGLGLLDSLAAGLATVP